MGENCHRSEDDNGTRGGCQNLEKVTCDDKTEVDEMTQTDGRRHTPYISPFKLEHPKKGKLCTEVNFL